MIKQKPLVLVLAFPVISSEASDNSFDLPEFTLLPTYAGLLKKLHIFCWIIVLFLLCIGFNATIY